jgi:lysophosphatidylcholine acyltransferase/lyso-PAF acetyltransferase
MHFHRGAFVPGAPVKPVLLRYPYRSFSPSWESITAPAHLFRFLTQFVNYCTVTLYPVYTPTPEEAADPTLYADNVRAYMSKMSGLPTSESTLEDKKEFLQLIRGNKRLD